MSIVLSTKRQSRKLARITFITTTRCGIRLVPFRISSFWLQPFGWWPGYFANWRSPPTAATVFVFIVGTMPCLLRYYFILNGILIVSEGRARSCIKKDDKKEWSQQMLSDWVAFCRTDSCRSSVTTTESVLLLEDNV